MDRCENAGSRISCALRHSGSPDSEVNSPRVGNAVPITVCGLATNLAKRVSSHRSSNMSSPDAT